VGPPIVADVLKDHYNIHSFIRARKKYLIVIYIACHFLLSFCKCTFRPHRMRDLSVCVIVCLSVCWLHGRAVQKRLNRSRCRLEGWLILVQLQGTMY